MLVAHYAEFHSTIVGLLEFSRRIAARSVNALMTATYWEIGRIIVEFEQGGAERASYGEALISRLADDLTVRFGRGFSKRNIDQMRRFYLSWPIVQTPSAQLVDAQDAPSKVPLLLPTLPSAQNLLKVAERFPLPWSAYVRLLAVKNILARNFYETEAIRGGWSVRQIDRQVDSQFYERTALSKNKVAMLKKPVRSEAGDMLTPEEAIKDPFVLEFLDLKDEYSVCREGGNRGALRIGQPAQQGTRR